MTSATSPKRTKKFYRLEHSETGIGPYRQSMPLDSRYRFLTACEAVQDKCNVSFFSRYHKTPYRDGLGDPIEWFDASARFGFKNMKSLTKWWSDKEEVYRAFEEFGFEVVCYDVTERYDSHRQSVVSYHDMKNRTVLPFPA